MGSCYDDRRHYDVLGIGFGPSNLALAIALKEAEAPITAHFIDAAPDSVWQPGMLLIASDIQNNPLRDLVTPRNPKSHYTFTNYLFESGRLYDFLNLGILYPLRKDYSKYIQWAGRTSLNVSRIKLARTGYLTIGMATAGEWPRTMVSIPHMPL